MGEPRIKIDSLVKVSQLIMSKEAQWNEALITEVFNVDDMEAILCIPLRITQFEDVPFWKPDPKRIFYVKSAYKITHNLIIEERILEGAGRYHKYRELESLQPMWKRIWTMKVPPKVSVYSWRTCRDILPTKKRF